MDENNPVVLIGYGRHAVSVISTLTSAGRKIAGYTDLEPVSENPFNIQYFGKDEQYLSNPDESAEHFCTIGENAVRERLQEKYTNKGLSFTNIIHPTAFVEKTVKLGNGIFIGAMSYVNGLTRIGDGAIINNHVNIDHDCVIGNYAHLAPGTCLTGNVLVGPRSFLGCGCRVIPETIIESDAVVGAGSLVIRNVKSGQTVYGHPAKPAEQ